MLVCLVWLYISAREIASYYLIYWDLDSDALLEHRFRTTRRIPYAEIISVNPWPWDSDRPSSAILDIQYGRLASAFDTRSSIIANPSDHVAFLGALRSHAQQADFTV
jgi:hypothetical protein